MPWEPASDPMITVTETQVFSLTIRYYELFGGGVDPYTGITTEPTPVYYNIIVTPVMSNPSTITITGNGTTAVTISGYYGPSFDDKLKVMTTHDVVSPDNLKMPNYKNFDTLTTEPLGVGVWTKYANNTDNFEIIDFIPDPTRTRDIYYSCKVVGTGATTSKYTRVQDLNWTPGMNALKSALDATKRRKT